MKEGRPVYGKKHERKYEPTDCRSKSHSAPTDGSGGSSGGAIF